MSVAEQIDPDMDGPVRPGHGVKGFSPLPFFGDFLMVEKVTRRCAAEPRKINNSSVTIR